MDLKNTLHNLIFIFTCILGRLEFPKNFSMSRKPRKLRFFNMNFFRKFCISLNSASSTSSPIDLRKLAHTVDAFPSHLMVYNEKYLVFDLKLPSIDVYRLTRDVMSDASPFESSCIDSKQTPLMHRYRSTFLQESHTVSRRAAFLKVTSLWSPAW